MSFAATIALIAVYERWNARSRTSETLLAIPGQQLSALFVTSLTAGLATAPYASFHFSRIATYGLLANLAAMPFVTALVMPAGLASLIGHAVRARDHAARRDGMGSRWAARGRADRSVLARGHEGRAQPGAGGPRARLDRPLRSLRIAALCGRHGWPAWPVSPAHSSCTSRAPIPSSPSPRTARPSSSPDPMGHRRSSEGASHASPKARWRERNAYRAPSGGETDDDRSCDAERCVRQTAFGTIVAAWATPRACRRPASPPTSSSRRWMPPEAVPAPSLVLDADDFGRGQSRHNDASGDAPRPPRHAEGQAVAETILMSPTCAGQLPTTRARFAARALRQNEETTARLLKRRSPEP